MPKNTFSVNDVAPITEHERACAMRSYDAAVTRGDVPGTPEHDAWQDFGERTIHHAGRKAALVQNAEDKLANDLRTCLDGLVAGYTGTQPDGVVYQLAAEHLVRIARGLRDGANT